MSISSPSEKRRRDSDSIAAMLEDRLAAGAYAVGRRLPAERDLAAEFGVSRTAVRAALARLEDRGLVVRRVGSGTFVAALPEDGGHLAEIINPLELIEVRAAIEPRMVRLAAINATGRDLIEMDHLLARLGASRDDREAFSALDEAFHLSIARATRNPLMVSIYSQINDIRAHDLWSAQKDNILTPRRIDEYNAHHRAVVEALRARDADRAARIIEQHMEKARRDLLGAGA